MTTAQWSAPQGAETLLTTELNSLVDGGNAISAAISNDGAGEHQMYADFELYIAAQGSNRTKTGVQLYILPTVDGTNYGYGDASLDPPASSLVGVFVVDTGVLAARYTHLRQIMLPPLDFKVLVINDTGQTLAASANTLKMRRYNVEGV